MSRYKPYPKYKVSGVEWLGEVPEHWEKVSMRWVSKIYAGGTPDKNNQDYWEEGTIPWLNSGEVNQFYVTTPTTYITEDAYRNSSAKWIPKNSLVMALAGQGRTKGMVARLGIDTTCNQSMAAIVPTKEIESRFLLWWLAGNYQRIRNMAGGDLREGLNLELLGNIPCPYMSKNEQTAIADFLDRETVKIDTLIAKQQRLIALLKEKRQAVISHAVTKGLDPDAKMKESGVEWLGEVPEHWETPPLYLRYSIELGKMLKESRITGEHLMPYLRNTDVQWGEINLNNLPEMDIKPSEVGRYTVKEGDLLVCEGGEVGRSAIVNAVPFALGYQKALHRLRPYTASELPKFMYYTMLWAVATGVFTLGGLSTIAHLTGEQLRRYRFPTPPYKEQKQIVEYLDTQTAKIDTLIEQAEKAIALLHERRTALISAAVTGKIKVNDEVREDTLGCDVRGA